METYLNPQKPNCHNAPTARQLPFKVIGVYLDRCFGPCHFRTLWELGSNENVCCVVELQYPRGYAGIRVGIPWGVVRLERPQPFSTPRGVG